MLIPLPPLPRLPRSRSRARAAQEASLTIDRLRQIIGAHPDWRDLSITFERIFDLSATEQLAAAVGVDAACETARVLFLTNAQGKPTLHWALGVHSVGQWQHPPTDMQPPNTERYDDLAVRSTFAARADRTWELELNIHQVKDPLPRAVNLVIYDALGERWLKHHGHDIQVRLSQPAGAGRSSLEPFIEQIADAEAGDASWTLMHRFNLCYELLDEIDSDADGLALLYAWLRYSAIRQLDWQRNYNTKPSELAHAQDRLTRRFAQLFTPRTAAGQWARLMLSTVGRGSEGQQVRDQILHIMHRHHIKERHGTWIEQWHQKLHNNTTPDDIIICQAYLAFLQNNGDINAYHHALQQGGVTEERLASFERPITESPDFFADKKDGLIHDFYQFLHLLKSVHAGADLETSIDMAHHLLADDFANWLRHLLHEQPQSTDHLTNLLHAFTDARRHLYNLIGAQHDVAARRALLYVDLGLEAQLRKVVEQHDLSRATLAELANMTRSLLDNLALTEPGDEYAAITRTWQRIALDDSSDHDMLLLASATSERVSRAVRDATDAFYQRLQPKAEQLGQRSNVDDWAIPIFTEEVVRGTLAFVLSKLMRHLEPALRQRLGLGGWQIISRGEAVGRMHVVDALRSVQGEQFDEPTILLADEVSGDEDIPDNIRAVLTRQTPDLVSHVAVRARNQHVLLASCLDEAPYQQLQAQRDQQMHIITTASGDLRFDVAAITHADADISPTDDASHPPVSLQRPELSMDIIGPADFSPGRVGGKSYNLAQLRRRCQTGWIYRRPLR